MFCKFITVGLALTASLGLSNAALSQVKYASLSELEFDTTNVVSLAEIGGRCKVLSIAGKDLTTMCEDTLSHQVEDCIFLYSFYQDVGRACSQTRISIF